jgi:hypothetical protein
VGVVTLVMACLLAAMWVRSIFVFDLAAVSFGDCRLLFVSRKQTFQTILQTNRPIWVFVEDKETWIWSFERSDFTPGFLFNSQSSRLKMVTHPTERTSIPLIYYWSIVLPLTLLSAYLLLIKPRVARPKIEST